ncbi:MAG: DUF368 domain-containing protein [Clostridia bacterium]|nr:DUF368 domain-containing protein [Clostridia bacterium]
MKKNILITVLKGAWIGGTMTVPGISGGSMAMILGVYDRLIFAVNHAIRLHKDSILFLIEFLAGAASGMVLFSRSLLHLLEKYPMTMQYFFLGCVVGGAPMIYRAAKVKKFTWKAIAYPLFGILLVYLISLLPEGLFSAEAHRGLGGILLQLAGGVIIAVALVLPGISVSQMLLMLGLYEEVMQAISTLHILSILPLGIGVVLGILLTAKIMETAMERAPQFTYLVVLGFIFGSVPELFPGIPTGWTALFSLLTATAGFFAVFFITRKEGTASE